MKISAIERAFEIARSGEVRHVEHIRKKLRNEGHDQNQIYGRPLSRQLVEVMRESGALEKAK
jgi:hypothetical protein